MCYACGLSVFNQVRSGSHTVETNFQSKTPRFQKHFLTNTHKHIINQECVFEEIINSGVAGFHM